MAFGSEIIFCHDCVKEMCDNPHPIEGGFANGQSFSSSLFLSASPSPEATFHTTLEDSDMIK